MGHGNMMNDEELLEKILRKNPDLSREEVEKKVEELLKEIPLLTRQGALLLLLGGENLEKSKDFSITKIGNLTPGLTNVNVIGRVIASKLIEYESGRKTYRVRIGDETGKVDVILWDEIAGKYEKLGARVGDVIKISGASVRGSSIVGNIELILHSGGSIEKIEKEEIPKLYEFFKSLTEALRDKQGDYIDAWAVVLYVGEPKFIEKESRKLILVEAIVGDDSENYLLNVWLESGREEEVKLKVGETILLSNLLVKDSEEFSITSRTYVYRMNTDVQEEFMQRVEKALKRIEDTELRVFDILEDAGDSKLVIVGDGKSVYRMKIKGDVRVNVGDYIRALNSVKIRRRDRLHIYAEGITLLSSGESKQHDIPLPKPVKLSELLSGERDMVDIIVRGILSRKTPLSLSETRYGSSQVIQFWIEDEEGYVVSCMAWGEKAVEVDKIPERKEIELRWVSVRTNRYGEREIRIEKHSIIKLI